MKKLILGLAIFASIGTSAFAANPPLKGYKTPDSMGCMMLQECKEGVEEITSWKQFGVTGYEPFAEELDSIFAGLNKSGIKVFLADEKYFIPLARGLYYVLGNNMFLNKYYIYNPLMMVKVVRHESWHAAQDCMAGTIDNSMIALIMDEEKVPTIWQKIAEASYTSTPHAIPWEKEATWAGKTAGMTQKALAACADGEMWKVYEPTPLTRKWLIENNYIDK